MFTATMLVSAIGCENKDAEETVEIIECGEISTGIERTSEKENSSVSETNAEYESFSASESTSEEKSGSAAETTGTEETVGKAIVYKDTGSEELNKICDNILNRIVDSSMSERELAYSVYCYVEKNISYAGVTPQEGFITAGIKTLKIGKGNCYGYYAASAALLTRLGFENIEIHTEDLSHFWNMVKIEGSWYHFDTTNGWGAQRFLFTDAQLASYSYNNPDVGLICYSWDRSKYPATP